MIEPLTADDDHAPGLSRKADAALLGVEVVWSRGRPTVLVRGELDVFTAPLLRSVLEHVRCAYGGPVNACLRQVSFIDSRGAEPLLEHGVHVRTASRTVERLLRLLDGAGTTPPTDRSVASHNCPAAPRVDARPPARPYGTRAAVGATAT